MNYEKKYKEALEKARQFSERPLQEDSSGIVEYIFPELKESEDEKIRKALLESFEYQIKESHPDKEWVCGVKLKEIVTWLEKQGEQKPLDYENANIQQKDFAPKAATANRQLYNRAILKLLSDYVEKYPDIRFGQMLCNLDIKPHFDEESRKTYCNLNETINKQKS